MLPNENSRKDDEKGTVSEEATAERGADALPLLNEALALVPGCRSGRPTELGALAFILGLIIPHLPDGFGRATLERAHHVFSAEIIDPLFAAGLLERAAVTLLRFQGDHLATRIAPRLRPAEP